MNKKLIKTKLPYIGAILSLIPALLISFEDSAILISILLAIAIVLNIWALKNPTYIINTVINFVNSGVMFAFAIDTLLTGKSSIQYAYFIAGALFLFAAFRGIYKNKRIKNEATR